MHVTELASFGVGIVGYGSWGRNHARVFNEFEDARVTAICDARITSLEDAARRFPDAHLTASVDDLLGMSDVDVVVVCTPASAHFGVTRQCLLARRHVLVEKPITTNSREAVLLEELAEEFDLTLMVGHTFLYNQGVLKLKECIATGEVGRVHYLYARRTNLGPIRHDVNALWDLAPHDIAIFNHLIDATPLWVSAVGARVLRQQLEDVGFISLAYPDNVLGHIHVSWSDPSKVREVVVVGSKERVVFDDVDTVEQVRIYERGVEAVSSEHVDGFAEIRLSVRDGDIRSPRLAAWEPLKRECAHFLECVRDGVPPMSGAAQGIDVVRVMEAIDASLALHGAPVEIRRQNVALEAVVGS